MINRSVAGAFRRTEPKPPKPLSERRRALAYAIEELNFRREMLAELAPATDNYEYMMWKVAALERAIAELQKPYFEVSPLI